MSWSATMWLSRVMASIIFQGSGVTESGHNGVWEASSGHPKSPVLELTPLQHAQELLLNRLGGGVVGGDDTILVIAPDNATAEAVQEKLLGMLERG